MQLLICVSVFPANSHFEGTLFFFRYFIIKEGDGVVSFWFVSELYATSVVNTVMVGCQWVSMVFLNYFKGVVHIPSISWVSYMVGLTVWTLLMNSHANIIEHHYYWTPHWCTLYLLVDFAFKHDICCRQNQFEQIHNVLQCKCGLLSKSLIPLSDICLSHQVHL